MKFEFVGVGSASCGPDQWHTAAVLTKNDGNRRSLLIDCGSDARFSLHDAMIRLQDVGGVYISHLHADHVGGMEWLAFSTFFNPTLDRPTLFCDYQLMHKMWESSLRGGLDSIEGKVMTLTDYFDCKPILANQSFEWGDATLTPVQTVHIMAGYQIVHSFGLMIAINNGYDGTPEDSRTKVFYTADTQFCPHQIRCFYDQAHLIFHDCETASNHSGVHAHYDDLKTLPDEIRKKMWLMHYQPVQDIIDMQKRAKDDGFAGFVEKGQCFDLEAV